MVSDEIDGEKTRYNTISGTNAAAMRPYDVFNVYSHIV